MKSLGREKKGQIAVFIPVYNEEETLADILSQIPKTVLNYEVTIVTSDDCSTDKSANIVAEYTPFVVHLKKNGGVGVSTKIGFRYAAEMGIDFKYLIKLDADGQHDLRYIPQIVAKLDGGADVVICSRFHPLSDQSHTPIDRVLLNGIFTEMVRKITGWEITDVRSGYMGFKFPLIKQIAQQMIVERYGVPMEILLRIWNIKADAIIAEIPHPALYGGHISQKIAEKYSSEEFEHKTTRLQEAYNALLSVIDDMKIPREYILRMNGYLHY